MIYLLNLITIRCFSVAIKGLIELFVMIGNICLV